MKARDEVSDDELLREGLERDPTVYFQYGDKAEGYWKGEDMVQQVLDKAIPVFENEKSMERNVKLVFYSTIHPTRVCLQRMH